VRACGRLVFELSVNGGVFPLADVETVTYRYFRLDNDDLDVVIPELVICAFVCYFFIDMFLLVSACAPIVSQLTNKAQMPLGSSRHVTSRHYTFDMLSPCILAVSSLSNSTARHARHEALDASNVSCRDGT